MTDVNDVTLDNLRNGLLVSVAVGALFSMLLTAKSIRDFSAPGPRMTEEVMSHYRLYLLGSLARLAFFVFLIATFMAFSGAAAYIAASLAIDADYRPWLAAVAAVVAAGSFSARALLRTLFHSPGVIVASSLYSMHHFYPVWQRLSPARLRALDAIVFGTLAALFTAGLIALARASAWEAMWALGAIGAAYGSVQQAAGRRPEPRPVPRNSKASSPNILMIGADTLRADRIGGMGYRRELTPNIDALARRGSHFTDCYVPCARTAPSMASMLTGTWPHTHRIRDNFIAPEDTRLQVPTLPEILAKLGYSTGAVGDWAASDVTKLGFGFEHRDLAQDQWNMKYFLRQGPKDMRLFLSLFTQNWFGKTFLSEIYYLGGVPLTDEIGRDTRRMIAKLAADERPFFIMSFMATTHPPFTSRHPYYTLFADPGYNGPSKFAMARLRDPFEIIRRQGEPKTEFDLEQIIDLYDGCVKNFDDETGRILAYLEASGLADNTIVVIFSDHGFEFFEHETWGQGNTAIGDFSARVPLIIADPRRPGGRVINSVVRTADLAPTLLELAGAAVPPHMEGVSITPLMNDQPMPGELPAFYETGVWFTDLPGTPEGHLRYPHLPELLEVPDKALGMIALKPQYQDIVVLAKDRMVRLGDWKLTYQPLTDGALYRLFNIRQDPACRDDVIREHPDIAQQLKQLLAQWLDQDAEQSRFHGDNTDDHQGTGTA